MRGTQDHCRWGEYGGGIIPAYAGNTRSLPVGRVWRRDHPRICGEHHTVSYPQHLCGGSSPHMRGTLIVISWWARTAGIIPAYAGNTAFSSLARLSNWDHPRICGEHTLSSLPVKLLAGSSPHMRGTPRAVELRYVGHGIIPAYAGNTPLSR